jgi:hypothetical protein
MKKVLIGFLAISFAGSVFALDFGNGFSLVGELATGLSVDSADDGKDDTVDTRIQPNNDDAGVKFRARLTFQYKNDIGGVKVRLQSRPDKGGTEYIPSNTSAPFFTRYAYGWVNLLDNKITVYGGQLGVDALWNHGRLPANVIDNSLDTDHLGIRAEFKVVEGLNFGFLLPFEPLSFSYTATGAGGSTSAENKSRTLGDAFGNMTFGAYYGSDLFKVVAALKLHPELDAQDYVDDVSTSTIVQKGWIDVIGGLAVPVGDLSIEVGVRYDGRTSDDHGNGIYNAVAVTPGYLEDVGKTGYLRVAPSLTYTMGALVLHARGNIWVPNDDKNPGKDVPTTEKKGETAIAARIDVNYALSSTIGAYFRIGSDNVSYFSADYDVAKGTDTNGKTGNGLFIRPGIKFALGASNIEIFDTINRIGAGDIPVGTEKVSPITNRFGIDAYLRF